ncbi:MAG: ribonuclease HII [Bacteroidia bacterium]
MPLKAYFDEKLVEAGCDEAGRGCLAGPVYAAAVILHKDFYHPLLNDSKKVTEANRNKLRDVIEKEAIAFAVEEVSSKEIDEVNILNASFLAMHKAIAKLACKPELLLIDGNRFKNYPGIPHKCIIKGDAEFASIAAASILAKTYRDDYMKQLHKQHPRYGWIKNKGYGTESHREAIDKYGVTEHHRNSFQLVQWDLFHQH